MKAFLTVFLTMVFTQLFAQNLEYRTILEVNRAEPIHTGQQGLKKLNALLKKNFNITKSQIARINLMAGSKIAKMHEYEELIGKYKTVILEESFSANPNHKKLSFLYEKLVGLKEQKLAMWVSIKKNIWKILGVELPQEERINEPVSSLRW